jgi:hypothetical protein
MPAERAVVAGWAEQRDGAAVVGKLNLPDVASLPQPDCARSAPATLGR